jgi:glycosyltransferase involved in cell wall biosynthesis
LLVCIAKNDRAAPLFDAMADLVPGTMRLGRVAPSRVTKVMAAIKSVSSSLAQTRSDMEFSPIIAGAARRLTAERLRECPGVTHVLQWGAMYAPVENVQQLSYSLVTDGPFDPEDASYPVEWKPRRWAKEYFARQRKIYTEATLVFTLSEWAREKLLAVHSLDPERVIRIGWGPMFTAEPSATITPSKLLVSIGNEWHRKGMDVVARAAARLHREDSGAETIIAGDPVGLHLAPEAGVTILPQRLPLSEVKKLIRRARAVVVASRFDASPHILLEALQMGVPVIASRVCGMAEAVQAPLGGIVVPAGDEDALFEAMRSLLQGDPQTQRSNALQAYAAMGGWPSAAHRAVEAMRANGVL